MPYPVHPEMLEWYTSRADTDEQLRAMLSAAAFSSAPLPPAAAAALPALASQQQQQQQQQQQEQQRLLRQQQLASLRAERQRLRSLLEAARRLDEGGVGVGGGGGGGSGSGGLLAQLELAMRLARLYSPRQLEAMLGAAQRVRENVARASRLVEVLDAVEQREEERRRRMLEQQQQREREQQAGDDGSAPGD